LTNFKRLRIFNQQRNTTRDVMPTVATPEVKMATVQFRGSALSAMDTSLIHGAAA